MFGRDQYFAHLRGHFADSGGGGAGSCGSFWLAPHAGSDLWAGSTAASSSFRTVSMYHHAIVGRVSGWWVVGVPSESGSIEDSPPYGPVGDFDADSCGRGTTGASAQIDALVSFQPLEPGHSATPVGGAAGLVRGCGVCHRHLGQHLFTQSRVRGIDSVESDSLGPWTRDERDQLDQEFELIEEDGFRLVLPRPILFEHYPPIRSQTELLIGERRMEDVLDKLLETLVISSRNGSLGVQVEAVATLLTLRAARRPSEEGDLAFSGLRPQRKDPTNLSSRSRGRLRSIGGGVARVVLDVAPETAGPQNVSGAAADTPGNLGSLAIGQSRQIAEGHGSIGFVANEDPISDQSMVANAVWRASVTVRLTDEQLSELRPYTTRRSRVSK